MLKTPKAKIFFKLKGNFLFVIIYINAFFNMWFSLLDEVIEDLLSIPFPFISSFKMLLTIEFIDSYFITYAFISDVLIVWFVNPISSLLLSS